MVRGWKLACVFMAVALAGCASGERGDRHKGGTAVAEAEVPQPVRDSLVKAFPGTKATGWTHRGDRFSMHGEVSGHWIDCRFAADGTLKSSDEEITLATAPAAVKKAFAESLYSKMIYVDGSISMRSGKVGAAVYKFFVKDGDKVQQIAAFGEDGSPVKAKCCCHEKQKPDPVIAQ